MYEVRVCRAIDAASSFRGNEVIIRRMTDNTAIVFHGFLNLTNLEKLKLVEIMNDYFDNIPKRESIRAENEMRFAELRDAESKLTCKCCGEAIS